MKSLAMMACVAAGLVALAAAPAATLAAEESTGESAQASAAKAAMRAGSEKWVADYNAGNVEQVLAVYAPDAVVMPPDAPLARGLAQIRRFLEGDIASSKAEGLKFVVSEDASGVAGNTGWNSGTFKVVDAGGATAGTGKFVEVWRNDGGKWFMIRDIWNSDAAAPAPAPAAAK